MLEIKDDNFSEYLAANPLLVVDFWATWCGPCKAIAPTIEALAADYEGRVAFGKCNVDDAFDLPVQYSVRNIPTVLFFKNGQLVDQMVGAAQRSAYEDKIKELIG